MSPEILEETSEDIAVDVLTSNDKSAEILEEASVETAVDLVTSSVDNLEVKDVSADNLADVAEETSPDT